MNNSKTYIRKNGPVQQEGHSQDRLAWLMIFILLLSFYIPYYLVFVTTELHWSFPDEIKKIGVMLGESLEWGILVGGILAVSINIYRLSKYFWHFGTPKLWKIKNSVELRRKGKGKSDLVDRLTFSMLIVFLGVVGYAVESDLLIHLFIALILYDVTANVFLFLPPAVVFLSTSKTDMLLQNVKMGALPYPLALLINNKSPQAAVPFFPEYSIYRANPAIIGPDLVNNILKMCRVIMFDSREINEPILTEANIIFANKMDHKTIFIVKDKIENQVVDEVLKNYRSTKETKRLDRILSTRLLTEDEVSGFIENVIGIKNFGN